jgi:hypothetical protein
MAGFGFSDDRWLDSLWGRELAIGQVIILGGIFCGKKLFSGRFR